MVIHVKATDRPVTEIVGFSCDRCHKHVTVKDHLEFQEAHHISFTGGYASVFGDGAKVECDLCQYCLKELLAGAFRIIK